MWEILWSICPTLPCTWIIKAQVRGNWCWGMNLIARSKGMRHYWSVYVARQCWDTLVHGTKARNSWESILQGINPRGLIMYVSAPLYLSVPYCFSIAENGPLSSTIDVIIQLGKVLEGLVLDFKDFVDVDSFEVPDEFLHDTAHFWASFGVVPNLLFIWTVPFVSSCVIPTIVINPTICVSKTIPTPPYIASFSTSLTGVVFSSASNVAPPSYAELPLECEIEAS